MTRELVLMRLQEVSALTDRLARREAYEREVIAWLASVEEGLGRLRSPVVSLVASERGRILAIADGLRDPEVSERAAPRKAQRAMAALALSRVERALREIVAEIDGKLEGLREKLASFLAAASVSCPIPLPPQESAARSAWLGQVWSILGSNPETRSLYAYLNASMSPSDRGYLLEDVLLQMLEGDHDPIEAMRQARSGGVAPGTALD